MSQVACPFHKGGTCWAQREPPPLLLSSLKPTLQMIPAEPFGDSSLSVDLIGSSHPSHVANLEAIKALLGIQVPGGADWCAEAFSQRMTEPQST